MSNLKNINKGKYLYKLCVIVLCTLSSQVYAQVFNTVVHNGAKMHQFSTFNTSVWGNATNNGIWGSEESSLTWFYGITWKNDNSATMPGAGLFYFQQPRPAPYVNDTRQYLEGGHDWATSLGCSFPDIKLENAKDLYLVNNDAKVRDTFSFKDGHVIHDGNDFTVGDNDPGEILGYNETQFFVTNGNPKDTEGFLEREGISNADLEEAFPVGDDIGDYTPGRIRNSGIEDDFSMRVFSGTFANGRSGDNANDQTVGKTWDVEERSTGGSNVSLELQHNTATEGSVFGASRSKHYITHYVGITPNGVANGNGVDTTSNSEWDRLKYSNLYAGESGSGYITTGSAIANALVTKRDNLDQFSPYTKTVYSTTPVPVELLYLTAQWQGEDTRIDWSTAMELNNSHFILQRSFDNINFEDVDIINSKAENGNSNQILKYSYRDRDVKSMTYDVVYYRLHQFDFNGDNEIHGPVALNVDQEPLGALSHFTLYPNPANKSARVVGTNVNDAELSFTLIDKTGRVITQSNIEVNQGNFAVNVPINDLSTGVYYVVLKGAITSYTERLLIKK